MNAPADSNVSVSIQISPLSVPSMPLWFGEVAAFAQMLRQTGMLQAIQEQVRFARARFGHYDLIDFVAVLIGYMLSGEPTLLAFHERIAPFAGRVHGPLWPQPLASSLHSVPIFGRA